MLSINIFFYKIKLIKTPKLFEILRNIEKY
jgi:hypothetical protein